MNRQVSDERVRRFLDGAWEAAWDADSGEPFTHTLARALLDERGFRAESERQLQKAQADVCEALNERDDERSLSEARRKALVALIALIDWHNITKPCPGGLGVLEDHAELAADAVTADPRMTSEEQP
jgi:hypothetical protein